MYTSFLWTSLKLINNCIYLVSISAFVCELWVFAQLTSSLITQALTHPLTGTIFLYCSCLIPPLFPPCAAGPSQLDLLIPCAASSNIFPCSSIQMFFSLVPLVCPCILWLCSPPTRTPCLRFGVTSQQEQLSGQQTFSLRCFLQLTLIVFIWSHYLYLLVNFRLALPYLSSCSSYSASPLLTSIFVRFFHWLNQHLIPVLQDYSHWGLINWDTPVSIFSCPSFVISPWPIDRPVDHMTNLLSDQAHTASGSVRPVILDGFTNTEMVLCNYLMQLCIVWTWPKGIIVLYSERTYRKEYIYRYSENSASHNLTSKI